jgi:molybdopterin converting factor small subunit
LADVEMECTALFFASAAQAMGCREKIVSLPLDTTVGDAFDLLAIECVQLQSLVASCAYAIDGQLAPRETKLHDGCIFVILPPVSGG